MIRDTAIVEPLQPTVFSVKIRVISVISGEVFVLILLFPQEPYPSIQRAMICSKERQERRRICVVINHRGIFAVQNIVHANARRPSIAVKRKLALHRGIQREKVGKAELVREFRQCHC